MLWGACALAFSVLTLVALAALGALPMAMLALASYGFLVTSVLPAHAHFLGDYPPPIAPEVQEVVRVAAAKHALLLESGTRPPVFREFEELWMYAVMPGQRDSVMWGGSIDTNFWLQFTSGTPDFAAAELDALANDILGELNTLGIHMCRKDLTRGTCTRPVTQPHLLYLMSMGDAGVDQPGQFLYDLAARHGVQALEIDLPATMPPVRGSQKKEAKFFEAIFYPGRYHYIHGEIPLVLTNALSGNQLALSVFDHAGMPADALDALVQDAKSTFETHYGGRFCRADPAANQCNMEHAGLERDLEVWLRARATNDPTEIDTFLAEWPEGPHAEAARKRATRLRAMAKPPLQAPLGPVEEWSGRHPGESFVDTLPDGASGPEMTVVPAGVLHMGCASPVGCLLEELPVHEVRMARPFALSTHEVTHAEFFRHASPNKRIEPWWADRPVTHLTWGEATAYAAWLSEKTGAEYRLPSESEWEWAARAGTLTAYPWGDEMERTRARCRKCPWQIRGTGKWGHEVSGLDWVSAIGTYPANAWGFHDMHGNAAEWTADCWNPDHLGAPADGSARLDGDCSRRVVRGGSYDTPPRAIRSAARVGKPADERYLEVGFRVLRELRPSGPRAARRAPSATP